MNQIKQISELNQSQQIIIPVGESNLENIKKDFFSGSSFSFFEAKQNEFYVLENNTKNYFLIGLGEKDSYAELQKIAKKFSNQFRKQIEEKEIQIILPKNWNEQQIKAFLIGLFVGAYQIRKPNLEQPIEHPFWNENLTLNLYQEQSNFNLAAIANTCYTIASAQFTCMDWLNKAPNQKNSEIIAEFAESFAKKNGFDCKILNGAECEKQNLNAFLAVNQGSAYEPAFIIFEYKAENPKKKIGLVGKCVTFDTGGISIKGSQNMHYMKSDMGGATAVLGTLQAVSQLQLPIHLIAILPATDNAVDKNSYLPGDVIESYSGKTIEVINTDAEGRMTMADALNYLTKNYQPEVLMNIATLTGSAVRTFGYYGAALLTNNSELEQTIRTAGEKVGQKSWPLPLWNEYLDDIQSDVADLKHIAHHPASDVIYAAKFLQQFTDEHPCWAHLDIAGVAFGNNDYSKEKSATGYGVQLLLEVFEQLVTE